MSDLFPQTSGAFTATGTGVDIVGTTRKIEQFPATGKICRYQVRLRELKDLQAMIQTEMKSARLGIVTLIASG